MDKQRAHGTAHFRKAAYRREEEGKATKEEFKSCLCRRDVVIRKAKAQLALRLEKDVRAPGKASTTTSTVKD